MGFFGSGDKIQKSYDQRTAGSDNAQVASLNGRIFNVGGKGNPTAAFETETKTPAISTVLIVVIAAALAWALLKKS